MSNPSRTNRERDEFIVSRFQQGMLFSDVIRDVQRNFGGNYTQLTHLVHRLAHRIMGQNMSMSERLVQYRIILKAGWDIYHEAMRQDEHKNANPKIGLAALGLLSNLIGTDELIGEGKDNKVEEEPQLEICERSA